ncbi:phosphoribosyl anthranilate isomerase [Legionella lansingensis]|uniref:N-(5'-phosphoribosyl)anthranilate isomerase n=2 Tax=Legionella lansingensis TaxID=45067 RepID=A0A0W0VTK3_9GAMM|nr:phosphoribosylanthranilate isomerase [Legionella lansingensis]KTD23418.1 N-(5'-phosphoribosyl)anthranilate isomerase [Legionella lansingensis]SNV49610.1 phosphoribosyl anthranilate isomerase [Legionella lansingensis]
MCGMTRKQDIAHAIDLGVDAIGLIFYPQSPRYVSVPQAKLLVQDIPVFVDILAVVVNPESSLVEQIINELPIQGVQFHGQESARFCSQFKIPYVKAISAHSKEAIMELSAEFQEAAAILLDTPSRSYGGTGSRFDWRIIPQKRVKPIILAGGLNASNVKEAVSICSPFAVDVCSGIEASPGIKDHGKMNDFVNALWGKA